MDADSARRFAQKHQEFVAELEAHQPEQAEHQASPEERFASIAYGMLDSSRLGTDVYYTTLRMSSVLPAEESAPAVEVTIEARQDRHPLISFRPELTRSISATWTVDDQEFAREAVTIKEVFAATDDALRRLALIEESFATAKKHHQAQQTDDTVAAN